MQNPGLLQQIVDGYRGGDNGPGDGHTGKELSDAASGDDDKEPDRAKAADAKQIDQGGDQHLIFRPQNGSEDLREGIDGIEGGDAAANVLRQVNHLRVSGKEEHERGSKDQ